MKHNIMGRGIMAVAMVAAGVAAPAQTMRLLDGATTEDGTTYSLVSEAISPNHRYIAGQAVNYDTYTYGMFVYDLQDNKFTFARQAGWMNCDLRSVSDEGVAVGYDATAITLSIDGTQTALPSPEGTMGHAMDMSDDGTLVAGYYLNEMDFTSHACVWQGGEFAALPEPTAEELGHDVYGTEAIYTTADGSIVVGSVVDYISTGSLIVWRQQADGSYEADVVSQGYVSTDGSDPERPYTQFTPTGLSRNGSYIALKVMQADGMQRMARYALATGALEVCSPSGSGSIDADAGLESAAVADDGTIVGTAFTGSAMYQKMNACMWRGGESEPVLIASLGDGLADLATLDSYGGNYVFDITPDATHITGYAYDSSYNYVSYVVNLAGDNTGISGTQALPNTAITSRHTLGGRRIAAPQKGINIVRRADGTVVKQVVK